MINPWVGLGNTWVGAGKKTGPWEEGTVRITVVDASGGSDAMGTGMVRSVTIGLERETTDDSQPQDDELPIQGESQREYEVLQPDSDATTSNARESPVPKVILEAGTRCMFMVFLIFLDLTPPRWTQGPGSYPAGRSVRFLSHRSGTKKTTSGCYRNEVIGNGVAILNGISRRDRLLG